MMERRLVRAALGAAVVLTALVAPAASAGAVGEGTYTQITSPSGPTTVSYTIGTPKSITVSGNVSSDVTSVDIACITRIANHEPEIQALATNVAVNARHFAVAASLPAQPAVSCRLAAIPSGAQTDGYLSSYTGPILYLDGFAPQKVGSTVYGYITAASEGDGVAILADASTCGTEALATVQRPLMQAGAVMKTCLFSLPPTDVGPDASATPDGSAIRVDGRNAYLPQGVAGYLRGSLSLPVTTPPLTVTRSVAANGDATITESAPLSRCSVSNTYPPTTTSCPHVTGTGVTFSRTTSFGHGGHQIAVRDAFRSTDHKAHSLSLLYRAAVQNQTNGATGTVGYQFPAHPAGFHAASPGQTLTGFGGHAGTVLIRSDLHSLEGDYSADTVAGSWSRSPAKAYFGKAGGGNLQLTYGLTAPAGGSVSLGFAVSERWATADVTPLASSAVTGFLPRPSISSPHNGAKAGSAKAIGVSGTVTSGANGLPTRVTVNGATAKLTASGSTKAGYQASVKLAKGRRTITVVATDAGGNTASSQVTITVT